jgi:uncharacterized protein Usg
LGAESQNKLKEWGTSHLLFENPDNQELKQKFDTLHKDLTNPFTLMKHWLKYEILDLEAILEIISKRSDLERKLNVEIKTMRDDFNELCRMEKGSYTLSTMFNNREKVSQKIMKLKNSLPNQEVEIMNLRIYVVLVTHQISQEAIPFFKRGKFSQYYESIKNFSAKEVMNCQRQMSLF